MTWPRHCRIAGSDRGVPLDDLADVQALVLLGDPGMGKTHSMKLLANKAQEPGDRVVFESLGALQRMDEIRRAVFASEPVERWKSSTGTLHLFLDGLDEALVATPNLGQLLVRELKALPDPSRLRFRLSCRTLHWGRGTQAALEEVFGKGLVVAELQPLDAKELADALDRDFLVELIDRGLLDWSRTPLALQMLIDIWEAHNALPEDEEALYSQGLRLLFEEANELRSELGLVASHTPEELQQLGARIAALSVLGGLPEIFLPRAGRAVPEGDRSLTPSDLSDVPRALLAETVSTKAFRHLDSTDRGHRLAWIHRTWAEELTARYLAELELPVPVLRDLFEHPHDPERGLAPPLAETARRLAARAPRWHAALAELDPVTALLSPGTLAPDDRSRVVDALLSGVARGHLLHRLWDLLPGLEGVVHDGLEDQLRPWLERDPEGTAGRAAWVLAAGLAAHAKLSALAPVILDKVLDPEAPDELRVNGANFFHLVEEGRLSLRELALGRSDPSPSPRLQAACLRPLFPGVLSIEELGEVLRPGSPSAHRAGAVEYRVLAEQLIETFEKDAVLVALGWIEGEPRGEAGDIYRKLLARALELNDPEIDREAARILGRRAHDWTRQELPPQLLELPQDRRLDMAAEAAAECDDWHLGPQWLGLVVYGDFARLVERVDEAPTYGTLAWLAFAYDEGEHLDRALANQAALRGEPRFAEFFDRWGRRRDEILEARRAAREREQASWRERRKKPEPPPLDPPAPQRIDIRLQQLEEGDVNNEPIDIWWDLLHQLTLGPDSRSYGDVVGTSFEDLPGWQAADEDTRQRILDGALKVLAETEVDPASWLGKSQYSVAPLALELALQAVCLREGLVDELPAELWARHASVIVGQPMGSADTAWRKLLRARLMTHAPEAAASAVGVYLDNAGDEPSRWQQGIWLASRFWSPAMADVLHQRETHPAPPEGLAALVGCLLEHGETLLDATWEALGPDQAPLTAAMLHRAPSAVVDRVGTALRAKREWAQAVLHALAEQVFPTEQWAQAVEREDTLGFVLQLIVDVDGEIVDYSPSGWIGERGRLWMLWNQVLRALVARATPQAVQELERFATQPWMDHSLAQARANLRMASWEPPAVGALQDILAQKRRRAESDGQLLDLVVQTLREIEREDLRGKPDGRLPLLWVKQGPDWVPQPEDALSLELKHLLERRLGDLVVGRRVRVTREVELSRKLGDQPGERPDMVIRAEGTKPEPTVIVELKPSWNRELKRTLPDQLGRYLDQHPGCRAGLLVVGWYESSAWADSDARSRDMSRKNHDIRDELDIRALQVSAALERDVRVVHLDLGLERPGAEKDS